MKKIKILILGSTGMLGSMFALYLKNKNNFEILCTYRNFKKIKLLKLNSDQKIKLNVENFYQLKNVINIFKPDYIINCVGFIKQLCNNKNKNITKFLNQKFPFLILKSINKINTKLIHFSTDCVFSGLSGNYTENDVCDHSDYYGLTKHLGEIKSKNVINIRTSIIGIELKKNYSLLNWFLKQKKKVYGYRDSIFSGLTTLELARIVVKYIILKKIIHFGLFHISSNKISKYNLLKMIKKIYKKKILIIKETSVCINRSLDSKKFKNKTSYKPKTWIKMIKELKNFYEHI